MKKVLFFTLMIAFLGVTTLGLQSASAAYVPTEGDLIKTPNDSAVYYVDVDGKRRLFVNSPTFWSWYSGTWNDQNIIIVSQNDFDNIDIGDNMSIRSGTNLIKFQNSETVYAVTPGNKLCKATAHYGDNWRDRLVTIQNGFESDYIRDNNCVVDANSNLPDGTLFSYPSSHQRWYVENGKARPVVEDIGDNAFEHNRFQHKFIVSDVPMSMFANDKDIQNPLTTNELWIDSALLDDLRVSGLWNDGAMEYGGGGDSGLFHFDFYNTGKTDGRLIGVSLYIDGVLVNVKVIALGDYNDYKIRWDDYRIGTYNVKIVVDASNQIAESNENNNELTEVIEISQGVVSDSDIERVGVIANDIKVGWLAGDYSIIDKYFSAKSIELYSTPGSSLEKYDSFMIGNIYKYGENIVADTIVTVGSETQEFGLVFIREGGDWKWDFDATIKRMMDEYEKEQAAKDLGDSNGFVDLVVSGIEVYPSRPIVNSEDFQISVSIKNIGTKASVGSVLSTLDLLEFEDMPSIQGGPLLDETVISPNEIFEWTVTPYSSNEFFGISDVAGEKTIEVVLYPSEGVEDEMYSGNNTFTQSIEVYNN